MGRRWREINGPKKVIVHEGETEKVHAESA